MLGAATEVGFCPDGAAAARIQALAAELEAMNPCAEPARAGALLRGHWKLLYASLALQRTSTLASLTFGILPPTPVQVAELFNQVDPATGLWDNVIRFEDVETGQPGTAVTLGRYVVTDDDRLDLSFASAMVAERANLVRLPLDGDRLPAMTIRITYLDDGFRALRGTGGTLYLFERLDSAPLRWAREG